MDLARRIDDKCLKLVAVAFDMEDEHWVIQLPSSEPVEKTEPPSCGEPEARTFGDLAIEALPRARRVCRETNKWLPAITLPVVLLPQPNFGRGKDRQLGIVCARVLGPGPTELVKEDTPVVRRAIEKDLCPANRADSVWIDIALVSDFRWIEERPRKPPRARVASESALAAGMMIIRVTHNLFVSGDRARSAWEWHESVLRGQNLNVLRSSVFRVLRRLPGS